MARMAETSETIVVQNYTRTLNVSVTTRDGRVDKVTTWTTGKPKSTRVLAEVPKRLRK